MKGTLTTVTFTCPACGSGELEVVPDDEGADFFCRACSSRWHFELGWVQRVHLLHERHDVDCNADRGAAAGDEPTPSAADRRGPDTA